MERNKSNQKINSKFNSGTGGTFKYYLAQCLEIKRKPAHNMFGLAKILENNCIYFYYNPIFDQNTPNLETCKVQDKFKLLEGHNLHTFLEVFLVLFSNLN